MDVHQRLVLGPQLRDTLTRITQEAASLLAAEGAGLRLADGDELVRVATFGPLGAVMARERLRIGESLSGRVAASAQPLIVTDPGGDPRHDPLHRARADLHGFRSWLGVPLLDQGRVVGVLVMLSRVEQRFNQTDVRLLEAFASQAAIAIQNARLYERERERRRQLEAVRSVTEKLAGEPELAPLLELISQLTAELLGVGSVIVYLWDEAAQALIPRAWNGFGDWLRDLRFRLGEGLVGAVAERRGGIVVDDYPASPYAQTVFLEQTAASAVIGEPLLHEGQLRGVITATIQEPGRSLTEQDRQLLALFAAQAAIAIEHARLHEAREGAMAEVEVARRRSTFLADASARLASSLDYETTLASIPRLAVPNIADWCAVDIVEPDGGIRRAGIAHADPKRAALVQQLQRYPPGRQGAEGLPRVLRTGQSRLYPALSDELLQASAHGPEHLRILRELQPKSVIMVPLLARGQILGTLLFAVSGSRRPYGPEDLALAEDLAGRAALAVDNARLYRESQAAISLRDEFLSVAAHELRTPTTTLLAHAQLVLRAFDKEGRLDPRRTIRSLRAIEGQAERLGRLISQLLDISRIQVGRLALERELTDLEPLVRGVVAAAQTRASQHPITLRTDGALPALVDPLRLEQVVTNLLENAVKYSPEGSPIEVELARPSSDMVQVAVRDHGFGIPPERRAEIFERYYRGHAGDHASGMGLGLYISRQIVELHGGELLAEFPPDGGSRFLVRLPTAASAPALS
jgi:signal transduction histidine kinase/putative methionine-R-sulfoxide reductase with GAF domain